MQICATDPRFIRKEDVTAEVLQREKEVLRSQAAATGKPENVLDRIVEGKLGKFYEDNCLYEQHFIKDGGSALDGGRVDRLQDRQIRREHQRQPLFAIEGW